MSRRSSVEIAADLEARAAKHRAEAERRLAVASDGTCALMWDVEKALRALAAYCGTEGGRGWLVSAEDMRKSREEQWAKIKEIRHAAGKD